MNKVIQATKYTVSLFILIFLVLYTFRNLEHFSYENKLSILSIFLCFSSFYFFLTLPFYNILKPRISLKNFYLLNILTSMLNLILPMRGGVVYRAYSLKKKYEIGLREYAAVSVLLSITSFFILGISSYFVSINYLSEEVSSAVSYSSLVLFLISILILIFPRILLTFSFFKTKKYIFSKINLKNFVVTNIFYLFAIISYSAKIFFLFKVFSANVGIVEVTAISILHLSLGLVSILPGNLGLKELGFVGICSLFSINSELALGVMAMDRVFQVIFLSLGSYCYTRINSESFSSIFQKIRV